MQETIIFEDKIIKEEKKKLKSRIHIEKGFALVGLCCGIGALIVLSFQGLTIVGTYFIGIGLLCIIGSFIYVLYRTLWR